VEETTGLKPNGRDSFWLRHVAAAGVAGSAIYVLLQALYVEFYDDFGVRPEQVGLDRSAVLARAAWVALLVLLLAAIRALVMEHGRINSRPYAKRIWISVEVLVAVLALAGYLYVLAGVMERAAEKVADGQSIEGVFTLNLIDIRAYPARARWLGDPSARSPALADEVMFLGRGDEVAVFYTKNCSSILVPVQLVEIQLLEQGPSPEDIRLDWEPGACGK
jgi:hypothetical protein